MPDDTQTPGTPVTSASDSASAPSAVQNQTVKTSPPRESAYSRDEIIAAAKSFGATPHLVTGALHGSGKTQFTKAEATALIEAYKKREV